MHEMSIIKSVIGIVEKEMKRNRLKRLKSLRIRVGELTAADIPALTFYFEACARGTPLEGAAFEVEEAPLKARCSGCGAEFPVTGAPARCPKCNGTSVEKAVGSELDIVSMEAV